MRRFSELADLVGQILAILYLLRCPFCVTPPTGHARHISPAIDEERKSFLDGFDSWMDVTAPTVRYTLHRWLVVDAIPDFYGQSNNHHSSKTS
jgi:hypothetical protein